MTTVVLIRPGATAYDEQGRVQGVLDVPLSDRGRAEVAALSVALAGIALASLYCGPGESVARTAEAVGRAVGLRPKRVDELHNLDQGLWQGLQLDEIKRRSDLAPWLQKMQARHPFAEFVPLSAKKSSDVERLLGIVEPYLPEQPWLHEADALTDRSDRFLAAEIVREKLFRLTGDELPYTSTVIIDRYEEEGNLRRIAATIVVERDAHKGMVIGSGGERLKRIGSETRQELERLLGATVFIELWVKVRGGWADDEAHLRSYGYE